MGVATLFKSFQWLANHALLQSDLLCAQTFQLWESRSSYFQCSMSWNFGSQFVFRVLQNHKPPTTFRPSGHFSHQSKTTTPALPRNLLLSCETPTSAQPSGFKPLGGFVLSFVGRVVTTCYNPRKLLKPYLMLNAVWLRMTFYRFLKFSFLPTCKKAPDMILTVFVPLHEEPKLCW